MTEMKFCNIQVTMVLFLFGIYGCANTSNETRIPVNFGSQESIVNNCLQVVNYHLNVAANLEIPPHLSQVSPKKNGKEFDINTYFQYYDHLRMGEGYQLDYVYGADRPFLYARRNNEQVIQSFDDFAEKYDFTKYSNNPEYLKHLVIDNTAEGYMQIAILHLMGAQFYLSWHGNYDDDVVVCNQKLLGSVLLKTRSVLTEEGDDRWEELTQMEKRAKEMDLEPKVYATGQSIIVEIVDFTKWGGLMRVVYNISDQFPHEFQNIEYIPLIEFNIGIKF